MDVIRVYMESISGDECNPLPAAEQRRLIALAQGGDKTARNTVVSSMLRYVTQWAQKYAKRGCPLLDLVQVGTLGVVRAIEKFDLSRDIKFSTYATFWIRQKMTRATEKHSDKRSGEAADEDHGNERLFKDMPDRSSTGFPELATYQGEIAEHVQRAISNLPERSQIIVRRRLAGDTCAAIGKELGLVRTRIQQLEVAAHRELKRELGYLESSIS